MSAPTESCASCCYSVEDPLDADRRLLCRRYPPTPVVTNQAMGGFHTTKHMLPVVTGSDWCGEYLPPVEAR